MDLDIIEIRAYTYFEFDRQVKEISQTDLATLTSLMPLLRPIPITHQRLHRLNFISGTEAERGNLIKMYQNLVFRFCPVKGDRLLLTINNEIKLPHIIYIHQLQNLYYDLTGDVLKRPENPTRFQKNNLPAVTISENKPPPKTGIRPINGKYRTS